MMPKLSSRSLIVLASTFPRWQNDSVPAFVLGFVRHLRPLAASTTVIAPHAAHAKRKEQIDGNIVVRRFRYAYPYRYENLTYGQVAKRTLMYKLRGITYVVAELWVTFWVCARHRPAIINAHWLIPQGFVGLLIGRLFGAPVIVTIHGQDATFQLQGLTGKVVMAVKRYVLRHADAVVVNSSANQALCTKIWPGRTYPIIPMGIDVETFKQVTTRRRSKQFEILFVGRLAEVKGVRYLCEAMKLLAQKQRDVHLTIVGDGPERHSLEAYAAKNRLADIITFAGWVQASELPAYYASTDVFVGPSIVDSAGRVEALGLVFAEASAAGLPVIATNVGGITDIVKDEQTGLIVEQKDPVALADALEYLDTHPGVREAMGRAGQLFVAQNFGWGTVAKRYQALMEEVLRLR